MSDGLKNVSRGLISVSDGLRTVSVGLGNKFDGLRNMSNGHLQLTTYHIILIYHL